MDSKLTSPLIWLAGFFILLFVYTKIVGPIPFLINSVSTQKSTTFDVTGEGKSTVKPDIAFLQVGIQASGQTVKEVQDQINSVTRKVSESIKKAGVDSKDIKTSNYSINPAYDYISGTQRITGYNANTTLSVKVRNLDNVNKVIDTATLSGANQISGLTFEVDDRAKAEDEARQNAVVEAKEKAAGAARIAGFKLGRIINYSEAFRGGPGPMPLTVNAAKTEGGTPTQVEPGSSEITVNVTLSYEIQ